MEPRSDKAQIFEDELPAYYPSITLSATVQHKGWTITVQAADMNADQFVDLLARKGFTQSNPTPAAPKAATGEAPVCPYHGAMKESEKRPGTYFCPKKMADGSGYCKEKFPKS